MKTNKKITLFFMMLLPLFIMAETKEIPFTLDDRDRIIRTEQKVGALDAKIDSKVEGLRSEMNARFEAVDKRFDALNDHFDQLFKFLWAFIGIFTAMLVSVFGFAFWDRRLSLIPVKNENARMLNVLRDFSEHQPKLREILKNAGLL